MPTPSSLTLLSGLSSQNNWWGFDPNSFMTSLGQNVLDYGTGVLSGQTASVYPAPDSLTLNQWTPDTSVVSGSETTAGGSGGWMGSVALGGAIGQAIGSVYSAYSASKVAQINLDAQAHILKNNAALAQMGVEQAQRAGDAQIASLTMRAGALKATQRARMSANGITLGVGNAAEVTTTTEVNKREDMRRAAINALSASWGYARQANNFNMQSEASSIAANYRGQTAIPSAIGAAFESIGGVAESWYRFYR